MRNLRVFGSVVHGEATEESDIDLLVDTSEKTSPWFSAALVEELQEILDKRVDVVTTNGLYWLLRRRILKEARPLRKRTLAFTWRIFSHAPRKSNAIRRAAEGEFLKYTLTQDAVIRNFEIIGEAAKRVPAA